MMLHLNLGETPTSSHDKPIVTESNPKVLQSEPIFRQVSFEDDFHPTTIVSAPSWALASTNSTLQKNGQGDGASPIPEELTSYWFSTNAKKLFCPLDGESAEEAVNKMIEILEPATRSSKNCHSIVKGTNENIKDLLNEVDLQTVYTKAMYLREALCIARATINDGKHFSFRQCCNQAVRVVADELKPLSIISGQTVGGYLRDFRRGRAFSHYKTKALEDLGPLLSFFDVEHDLHILFTLQLASDLSKLSAKNAHQAFFRNIVPVAALKRGDDSQQKIISEHGLDRIYPIHFHKWLKLHDFESIKCPDTGLSVWNYTESVDL
eukprot:scaffold3001_cov122-Cylindrotheca_fusiformis.AAC.5